jgi:hypothetical protein
MSSGSELILLGGPERLVYDIEKRRQEVGVGTNRIDKDKLRDAVRRLGSEDVHYMLDDALDLLPDDMVRLLAGRYLDLKMLAPDDDADKDLLETITAFDKASYIRRLNEAGL